jgi:hypothetical protein
MPVVLIGIWSLTFHRPAYAGSIPFWWGLVPHRLTAGRAPRPDGRSRDPPTSPLRTTRRTSGPWRWSLGPRDTRPRVPPPPEPGPARRPRPPAAVCNPGGHARRLRAGYERHTARSDAADRLCDPSADANPDTGPDVDPDRDLRVSVTFAHAYAAADADSPADVHRVAWCLDAQAGRESLPSGRQTVQRVARLGRQEIWRGGHR